MKTILIKITLCLTFGIIISIINIYQNNNNTAPIKAEINDFISVEMDSCQVISISNNNKFSGMGNYIKIQSSCDHKWYPVLFEKMTYKDENFFKINSIIYKKSNSREIQIWDNNVKRVLIIRKPESLDDYSFLYFIWTFVIVFIIILLFIKI